MSHENEKKKQTHIIESTKELREIAPSLIQKVNADKHLALLAAANPILVLEELGYKFTDKSRNHLERILRFPEKTATQLESLEDEIHKIAGHSFKIDSPQELDQVLFKELKLPMIKQMSKAPVDLSKASSAVPKLSTSPLLHPIKRPLMKELTDPLSELEGSHPIMKPLLAYRKLDASSFRLATPEVYEKIKRGEIRLPITRIKFHVRSESTLKRGEK